MCCPNIRLAFLCELHFIQSICFVVHFIFSTHFAISYLVTRPLCPTRVDFPFITISFIFKRNLRHLTGNIQRLSRDCNVHYLLEGVLPSFRLYELTVLWLEPCFFTNIYAQLLFWGVQQLLLIVDGFAYLGLLVFGKQITRSFHNLTLCMTEQIITFKSFNRNCSSYNLWKLYYSKHRNKNQLKMLQLPRNSVLNSSNSKFITFIIIVLLSHLRN